MPQSTYTTRFLGSFPGELPAVDLPEIAFAGRSNVGKSSLLNTMVGVRKAARVSSTPGRTQAVNLFEVGGFVSFADLPGYGFAKAPDELVAQWGPMIEAYLQDRPNLALVVALIDVRRDPQPLDQMLVEALDAMDIPYRLVATKCDKLKSNPLRNQLAALERAYGQRPLEFSSLKRIGRDELWRCIHEACKARRRQGGAHGA